VAAQVEGAAEGLVARVQRSPGQGGRHHQQDRRGHQDPGQPAPARRRRRPGGRHQQEQADRGDGREADGREVQRHPPGAGQRARTDQQPPGQVLRRRRGGGQRQGNGQQQPAHRVAGPAAGQHRPDRGPLTMATTRNAVPGVSWTRSARPAWRSSRSSSGAAARVRTVSSHSAHADTTGQAGRLSPLALTSGPSRLPTRPGSARASPACVPGALRTPVGRPADRQRVAARATWSTRTTRLGIGTLLRTAAPVTAPPRLP
jgi:hypothetical protein